MKKIRDFKGVWIPKEIWLSDKLSLQEKVFLVEIDSLDNERGCFAGNNHFAEFFGLSASHCSEVISSLKNKGFISVDIDKSSGKSIRNIRVIKSDTTTEKQRVGIRENAEWPLGENAVPSNTYINNTISVSKDTEKTKVFYGNPDISFLISLLKENNHGIIDGSEKENRRYCWLLLQKLNYKNNPQKSKNGVEFIIKKILQSDFHSRNATNFKYLYKHASSIINDYRQSSIKNQIVKIS